MTLKIYRTRRRFQVAQQTEQFRPSRGLLAANRMMATFVRLGLPMRRTALLTVPGRVSGLPRTTPVALTPHPGGWSLIAPYGVVDWVKNLRAAGRAEVRFRGRRRRVVA